MTSTDVHPCRFVELTETTAQELAAFMGELNLDPAVDRQEARLIVSSMLCEQLRTNRQAWLDLLKRTVQPS